MSLFLCPRWRNITDFNHYICRRLAMESILMNYSEVDEFVYKTDVWKPQITDNLTVIDLTKIIFRNSQLDSNKVFFVHCKYCGQLVPT